MKNTNTSKWIEINWNNSQTQRNETIHGVNVKMFVSPYDIPKAVRGFIDENYFVIEFKYLNDEATTEKEHNASVVYKFGKFSHRLYAIKFDVSLFEKESGNLNITKFDRIANALTNLINEKNTNQKDNYVMARDAFRANQSELLAAA